MIITWITQGGFILESGGDRLVIDPYISDIAERNHNLTRLVPPPFEVPELNPDTVFCSHNHVDHLDPVAVPQIAQHYPASTFMGPKSVIDDLAEMGITRERMTTLSVGQKITSNNFALTATPAYHSDPEAIGLLIEADNRRIYISADSLFNDNLAKDVLECSGGKIDYVLICINGRLGNMDMDEAVEVVKAIQPTVVSPMHYGLFAENTVDPQPFVDTCRSLAIGTYLLEVGSPVDLEKLIAGAFYESN